MENPKPAIPPEIAEKMKAEDQLIAKAFGTPSGKKVLQILKEKYVETGLQGYVIDRNGSINAQATTFEMWQKEGQRLMIKNIEMRIERANSGTIKQS